MKNPSRTTVLVTPCTEPGCGDTSMPGRSGVVTGPAPAAPVDGGTPTPPATVDPPPSWVAAGADAWSAGSRTVLPHAVTDRTASMEPSTRARPPDEIVTGGPRS